MGIADREVVRPASRAAWRRWLAHHHSDSPGVWVEYPKVRSGLRGPAYDDLVEEALCFGWIDSVVRKTGIDGLKCMHVSPRQPGSIWARTNKERLLRLEAAGALTAAGLAVIERAKADGSWTLLDDVEGHVIAEDLAAALAQYPNAHGHLLAWPKGVLERSLYWCYSAKRSATRSERILALAAAAAIDQPPAQLG